MTLAQRLRRIDLLVFDKDGTLIDFHFMWERWVQDLAARLGAASGRAIEANLHRAMGTDPSTGRVLPEAPLAGSIMTRLRAVAVGVALDAGASPEAAEAAVALAWRPPDPVASARPLADLRALFGSLRAESRRIGVITADDRAPTWATLSALGVSDQIDAIRCADDALPMKPGPEMLLSLCAELGISPDRTAVVGDTPADLLMGRAAGASLVVGVLSGAGGAGELGPLADVIISSVTDLLPHEASA